MQEEYVKEEKRREEECAQNMNGNVVFNMRGALGEMGQFFRHLWN